MREMMFQSEPNGIEGRLYVEYVLRAVERSGVEIRVVLKRQAYQFATVLRSSASSSVSCAWLLMADAAANGALSPNW